MTAIAARAVDWTETGLVPDAVIRHGIRRLLERKLDEIHAGDIERSTLRKNAFVEHMDNGPVAPLPHVANEQHYEVPAAFFELVLGPRRKYSCCYWPDDVDTLDAAERTALDVTVERAGIEDGMRILDLGCGWGALSLWIAQRYPRSSVTSVSNSRSQRDAIVAEAGRLGIGNIEVIVADMNDFDTPARFERIVSLEMFEHMRNYRRLFGRVSGWLAPRGRFFMHIFCHRSTPYAYVDKGPGDWMSRHFFTGGIMPSADLPYLFADDLLVEQRWHWNGEHYARTLRSWLDRMDARKEKIMPILSTTYGEADADRWWMRWRIFFMACEELFAYRGGQEWFVGHYLLKNRGD